MDTPKVQPKAAVDTLREVLDSPEVAKAVECFDAIRWTGRKGYPPRAMIGMCLVKAMYALPTWSRTCRLVAEHPGLRLVLGSAPSQWACYRFARQLRVRDQWVLTGLTNMVLKALREQHPNMGRDIAIDASDLPAYAEGHGHTEDGDADTPPSDPDASWGHRSAVSTRAQGGFYGYKLHAAVDTATDLPIAWCIASGKESEKHYAIDLIDKSRASGFPVQTAIMDKGYDTNMIHARCEHRHVAPVIPLIEGRYGKRSASDPPHCVHGEWAYAGSDYKRRASKWRCPTGECNAKSMWVKASRLRPLIPRETKAYRNLYAKRGAIEREFGRLKHEWALLPLRVRGRSHVQLHADLTILGCLASRLAQDRTRVVPLAA